MSFSKTMFKLSKKVAKSAIKDAKKSVKPTREKSNTKKSYSNPDNLPEWQVYTDKNGLPTDYYNNGKEWLWVDCNYMCVSPSGKYFLFYSAFCGESDKEYIAITTKNEGIIKKACQIGVESAFITDEGVGYLFSDEGDLHILTAEKKSKKHLCNSFDPFILIPQGCFVASESSDTSKLEDHEQVIVKGMLFDTGKTWRKAIDYEIPDDEEELSMKLSNNNLEVTLPNKNIVVLEFNGNILKK